MSWKQAVGGAGMWLCFAVALVRWFRWQAKQNEQRKF